MSVHVKCAVLEIGKKFIRGGFAGESSPSFALDVSLVDKAQDRTELFGFISDTFKKIFNTFLQANPKECKVLIIEKLTFEKFLRDTILTVLLHEFKVHNTYSSSLLRVINKKGMFRLLEYPCNQVYTWALLEVTTLLG